MNKSHESLLLPTLKLARAAGGLSTQSAARLLAPEYLEEESFQQTKIGEAPYAHSLAAAALTSLTAAGLLETQGFGFWRITEAGKAVLESEPAAIDFEFLTRFASYRRHWNVIRRDDMRNRYLTLRFEHYVCGRLLLLQGSHYAAAALLAYAIEYHLKAALSEVQDTWTENDRKLVGRSHDLPSLYRACQNHSLLGGSHISVELLAYARDHFSRRYPRGERELLTTHGYWSFGGNLLPTIDDCITQLDLALADIYQTNTLTLGAKALAGFGIAPNLLNAFFHGNIFAIENLRLYREAAAEFPHAQENIPLDQLERPELLFAREGFSHPGITIQLAKRLLDYNLAAFFRYPKKGEPDPDPVRLTRKWRSLNQTNRLNYSRWVVKRVRQEFGDESVEIVEDRDTKRVTLVVFDRRAKKWHRSISLRPGVIGLFIQNTQSREFLDQWIADTKKQFQRRRRGFRHPPARRA